MIIKKRHISPPPGNNDESIGQSGKSIKIKKLNGKNSLFKFPFERRARSASPPKDDDPAR